MKVVIMAGGKGTRISSVASDIPKPMIKVEGVPVLEREIECLKDQGFDDIIMTVSHLGNIIMDYFGDGSGNSPATGKPFGVHIEYYFEKEPLGNAGALFKIKDKLTSDFLLLNADAMFDVDFNRFVAFHRKHDGLVTLFTHPNSHPYDSGLIIANKDGSVKKWLAKEDERPQYYRNRVNAGLHSLRMMNVSKFLNVNNAILNHKTKIVDATSGNNVTRFNWKTYYGYRNIIYSDRKHHMLWVGIRYHLARWLRAGISDFLNPSIDKEISKYNLQLIIDAIHDGLVGHLGINKDYRP